MQLSTRCSWRFRLKSRWLRPAQFGCSTCRRWRRPTSRRLEALSEKAAEPSGLEGLALGTTGDGGGVAGEAAAEFFGIGGYGQSFVYVVDCSDSMNEGGKFERAIYELLQSIEQLSGDQRYFVIFYNDDAYPDGCGPAGARE